MSRSVRRHAATIAVALLTAAVVAAPPVAAHVTKKVKHTWKHLQPLADARYELKGTPAQWGQIQGMPSGFADGVDNTGGTSSDVACTGCVSEGELSFDPATQSELDAHKTSGDHDTRYWKLDGNALVGTEFLGSTNNQPLNLRVNNDRAYRLEPATDPGAGEAFSPNVIGGGPTNDVTVGAYGATIAGGGRPAGGAQPPGPNRVTDAWGTVGGGYNNRAGDDAGSTTDRSFATVSGGSSNTASSFRSTVGGGFSNTASGANSPTVGGGLSNTASGSSATVSGGRFNLASNESATVGGGDSNTASGLRAAVGGGLQNTSSGNQATVAGGFSNTASGGLSFAAGTNALADDLGAFVWSDSCNGQFGSAQCPAAAGSIDLPSTAVDQFSARATGGFRFITAVDAANTPTAGATLAPGSSTWGTISDRASKENVVPVDGELILDRLSRIPVATWNWKTQDEAIRHIGPMAQDFYAAFGVGEDDKHITTVDADGVALAAIQGLNDKVTSLEERVSGPSGGQSGAFATGIWQVLAVLGLALGIALGGRGVRRQAAL